MPTTRSLADTYVSIPELMRLARGPYKRAIDAALFMDRLVLRGFITRDIDPNDGKASFALTERGHAAADAIFAGGRVVDKQLESKVSAADIAGMCRCLLALAEIKQSLPQS